ncbi:rRNA large subunit methyltransferase [Chitinivibrio alkaliphilus ACht1]|uniref:rRNA large subunit methyltransferase n=2 Tax=Chitinivibrio TaxID=1505231 RepID=U7D5T0_9BACT|nr:rRNA large subunit methyltransferase [Chitinivibrio alkaliphilus ACht1]
MISRWHRLEMQMLRPATAKSPQECMRIEAELLRAAQPASGVVVALGEEGRLFSTHELAQWFLRQQSMREMVFLMGSAHGMAASVKRESSLLLSLSPLTLPYGLCRLVLVEQIYRIATVAEKHPYHK